MEEDSMTTSTRIYDLEMSVSRLCRELKETEERIRIIMREKEGWKQRAEKAEQQVLMLEVEKTIR